MAFYRCAGGTDPTGNAGVGDVLKGKTFSNADGIDKTGTMTNRGAVSQSLNTSTTSYTIPAGYHNGSGKVSITTQEKTVTSSRSAQTVTPDSGKVLSKVTVNALAPTGTYKPTSRVNNNDMGATSNYRYVDTTAVPNTNSGTYTYVANSTGGTVDMGATNTYRYVNAANVYTKGKADGAQPFTMKVDASNDVSMRMTLTLNKKFSTMKLSSGTFNGSYPYLYYKQDSTSIGVGNYTGRFNTANQSANISEYTTVTFFLPGSGEGTQTAVITFS